MERKGKKGKKSSIMRWTEEINDTKREKRNERKLNGKGRE